MRKLLLPLLCLLFASTLMAQDSKKEEEKAIKKVVNEAYIDALHNKGDLDQTRNGFHPGFNLLIYDTHNNQLNKLPIYNWIASSEKRLKEDPNPPKVKTSCKFEFIDITGKAAVTKIKLYRADQLIFTDYLSLYKFDEGWKVVSKIYHRHTPPAPAR